jgi:hypothetical protein
MLVIGVTCDIDGMLIESSYLIPNDLCFAENRDKTIKLRLVQKFVRLSLPEALGFILHDYKGDFEGFIQSPVGTYSEQGFENIMEAEEKFAMTCKEHEHVLFLHSLASDLQMLWHEFWEATFIETLLERQQ